MFSSRALNTSTTSCKNTSPLWSLILVYTILGNKKLIENIARIVKAALQKSHGKSSWNVNYNIPVCPVYYLCPPWPICGFLSTCDKCLPKWPAWKVFKIVAVVRKLEVLRIYWSFWSISFIPLRARTAFFGALGRFPIWVFCFPVAGSSGKGPNFGSFLPRL